MSPIVKAAQCLVVSISLASDTFQRLDRVACDARPTAGYHVHTRAYPSVVFLTIERSLRRALSYNTSNA